MSGEKLNIDGAVENTTQIITRGEVNILVTEEDKTGEDLLAMSDSFNGYIEQLSEAIRVNALTVVVRDVPFADIGIINEVVHRAEVEAGTRVKDVTLKEVRINPGTMGASRSIANQLQMKQIFAKARGYGDFKGHREFSGGKVEAGETPQQALVR